MTLMMFFLLNSDGYAQNGYSQDFPNCGLTAASGVGNAEPEGDGCSQYFGNFLSNHLEDMIPENVSRTVKIKINVVFMQREDGSGCYSMSNPDHVTYWNNIFDEINARFQNIEQESCGCSTSPVHYNNIHLEFVPNYVEVQDEYHWNHENDPNLSGNSYGSSFLNECHNLASQEPEYQPGIDMVITIGKSSYDAYEQYDVPLWEVPDISPHYFIGGSSVWYSSVAKSIPSQLNHQAIWHAPDMYLGHINAEEHISSWYLNGPQFEWVVGAIMHETSHMLFFTVGHKDWCQKNVMNGHSSIRTSYTGCQVRQMYRALMTSYVRKYVVCEDVLEHDITVDADEEWNNNMRLYSNVVVKPGNTLKISCELYMQPHAKITVERGARLILGENAIIANGGVCNDADHETRWAGIQVEGNNSIPQKNAYALESYSLVAGDHGIVLLLNGSTLRDARTGIACLSPTQSGSDYWGGYVNAGGVSFLNNGRSFEFMLSNFNNKSVIDNCLFEGNPIDEDVAITNWHSNNVTIKNSEFNDFSQAIYSIDAGMDVTKNTFNRNKDAIAMDNMLFLSHSYNVVNNTFNLNHVSVKASGASSLIVRNNDFLQNEFGISIMGAGQATIKNNLFDFNTLGVDLQSTGYNFSPVHCNIFSDNSVGTNPSGYCNGIRYSQNQNGQIVDNWADMFLEANATNTENGRLSDFGTSSFPPLNTWSQNNNDRNIVTKPNETDVFTYFSPDNDLYIPQCYINDPDCQGVINNFYLSTTDESGNSGSCGTIGTSEVGGDIPSDKFPDLKIRETEPELVDKNNAEVIASIKDAYQNSEHGLVLGGEAGRKLLNISQQFIAQGDYDGLDTYLTQFGDDVLPLKYSIDVQRKDYTAASAKLNVLASTGGHDDYVLPQQLYLDWIDSKTNFADDQNFYNKLVELEQKDTPNSAYARSMLGILYGKKFEPKLPTINGAEVRSHIAATKLKDLVSPNPFDGEMKVVTTNYKAGSMTIYNVLGIQMYSSRVLNEKELSINTTAWKSGVYFLYLTDAMGNTHFEKIVKR